jgi:predicted amidophosphoribosyltransferase
MSRLYAIILLTILVGLACFYVYARPSIFQPLTPFEEPKESKVISDTWEDFLKDCGGEIVVENNVHARNIFNKKYEANIVTWTGYFAEAKQAMHQMNLWGQDHAVNILVKMMPSESALYPDLVLSIPTDVFNLRK